MNFFDAYIFFAIYITSVETYERKIYTNRFVIEIEGNNLQNILDSLSGRNISLRLLKHIVSDFYVFQKTDYPTENDELIYEGFQEEVENAVSNKIKFFKQESLHKRGNYLPGKDTNVLSAHRSQRDAISESLLHKILDVDKVWEAGYYGNNVKVAVVDCGVDMKHEDLYPNIVPGLSYDYIEDKEDGNPPDDYEYLDNLDHGTNCAGIIAGIKGNHLCGDGIAPNAGIAAVRIFSALGLTTDSAEAEALKHKLKDIDIYSNSWTTSDEALYDGPDRVTQEAIESGVNQGRNGRGAIYIFPSGNGGQEDNCNGDGYANSIYTITVSGSLINGSRPHYTEDCPCVLTTTLAEGGDDPLSLLVTCNRTNNGECSTVFRGSSVSAALASGVVALGLNANPELTWRDVQHLAIQSSTPGLLEKSGHWRRNGADLTIHDAFGFGLLNASEMIIKALNWTRVTKQHNCTILDLDLPTFKKRERFHHEINMYQLFKHFSTNACACTSREITRLEHVQVKLDMWAKNPQNIEILLKSPMKTASPLMTKRSKKVYSTSDINWTYMSVHFWDENPSGKWTLKINSTMDMNDHRMRHKAQIEIKHVSVIIYGTSTNEILDDSPSDVKGTKNFSQKLEDRGAGRIGEVFAFTFFLFPVTIALFFYCTGPRRHALGIIPTRVDPQPEESKDLTVDSMKREVQLSRKRSLSTGLDSDQFAKSKLPDVLSDQGIEEEKELSQ